jgi:hypothetical protein
MVWRLLAPVDAPVLRLNPFGRAQVIALLRVAGTFDEQLSRTGSSLPSSLRQEACRSGCSSNCLFYTIKDSSRCETECGARRVLLNPREHHSGRSPL